MGILKETLDIANDLNRNQMMQFHSIHDQFNNTHKRNVSHSFLLTADKSCNSSEINIKPYKLPLISQVDKFKKCCLIDKAILLENQVVQIGLVTSY